MSQRHDLQITKWKARRQARRGVRAIETIDMKDENTGCMYYTTLLFRMQSLARKGGDVQ